MNEFSQDSTKLSPEDGARDIRSVVRSLCAAGQFGKAVELKPLLPTADKNWLTAVDALIRGALPESEAAFAKYLRGTHSSREVTSPYRDPWGPLAMAVKAALHEPSRALDALYYKAERCTVWNRGLIEWFAVNFLKSLSSPDPGKIFRSSSFVSLLNDFITQYLAGPRDPKILFDALAANKPYNFTKMGVFYFLLTAFWIAPDVAGRWRPVYDDCAAQLSLDGLTFFAGELAACGAVLDGRDDGMRHPLRDLIKKQELWERSLAELEALSDAAESKARRTKNERRVIWRVSYTLGSRDSVDNLCNYIEVQPVEQSLQANGRWTKGRNVGIKTVMDGMQRIVGLSEQERGVREAVRQEIDFGFPTYYLDGEHALSLLAGCPNLFRDDDLTPLEVVRDEPHLEVQPVPGGSCVRMVPANPHASERIVWEESPSRLHAAEFTKAQKDVAAVFGAKGIVVPASGKERVLRVLSRLAPVVPVQSDVDGISAAVSTVAADSQLYAQLTPFCDGLAVEFVVRPFGPEGPSCRPGGGASSLFGVRPGENGEPERVQAKRTLAAERAALAAVVAACPALADVGESDAGRWEIPDPETSLEALLQIQGVESLKVEWPRGGMLKVRGELDSSRLLGAVQSSGTDWFALTGTAKVDEELTFSLRQLLNATSSNTSRFVAVGPGEFVALTKEFRRRLEALGDLAGGRGEEVKISPLAAAAVESLFDAEALIDDKKWRETCERFSAAQKILPAVPRTLRAQLRPYQADGFRWLARLACWGAGACLADDMGLGKTVQALALLLHRAPDGPALVVAPTSVCGNWIDETARFAPSLRVIDYRSSDRDTVLDGLDAFDVILVSYGLLQNHAEAFAARRWHTIILDEAQAVKNMSTKRSNAVMALRGDFRMIMTGTPVENHLAELWNLFRFLNPGLLGSLASFNHRFASPIGEGQSAPQNRLKKLISPFLLRRVKEDVLDDLPPRTEVTLRVELGAGERAVYEALRASAAEALADAAKNPEQDVRLAIFAQLMKLRRCCCSARLVDPTLSEMPSAKLSALLELAADMRENGHRALIFSQFVDHLTLIRAALEENGFNCLYLDGGTPSKQRGELVKKFQSGVGDCFLISLRAGGTGLNLTGADYVIHMDPWWNPAVEDQASDRAYRIGQNRPVTVYRLVARDTVEEKIVDLHRVKRELADGLLSGAASPARFDLQELLRLIRDDK